MTDKPQAEVIAVYPNKVKICVDDLGSFTEGHPLLRVGSYLRVTDHEDCVLIAIIESFLIEVDDRKNRRHVIEALPLGVIKDDKFIRGGDALTIPPTGVAPATIQDIKKIFEDSVPTNRKFEFSSLVTDPDIRVPVDGNRFFNKHIAVVGSTGAGKSNTVTRIIQTSTTKTPSGTQNNSHAIIFDIHSEYKAAFPHANHIDINSLNLPYWLLNSDELEEVLLDTGERDNYNQSSVFRYLVTENKKKHNKSHTKIFYDSPVFFDIHEVLNALHNIKNETVNAKNSNIYMINDGTYDLLKEGRTEPTTGVALDDNERIFRYFEKKLDFHPTKRESISNGGYADGSLDKFYTRFESKVAQERLGFLFGAGAKETTLENTLRNLIGYNPEENANVTVLDLSGIPFEVLSITVSLISRLIFEHGYHYKVYRTKKGETVNNDAPILLVYEEAHKYVPTSDLAKYRAAKQSIERIAKEGRKYGVTLLLSSQRPSEISETIFSQCNNFVAMRLTNPSDQNYVRRLLPDTLGKLIEKMPNLGAGEALLIGDSLVMPSLVKIDVCDPAPSSADIPYWELWKEEWKDLSFDQITTEWLK
ncbi:MULTISPECIES: anti-phage-associated helicase HerA [Pseudomonas]|uniref:anti-phage-associated helicase HerA n=1 Tax=Pseudomonas TaxID=286 RepID=UPI0015F86B61|nr:MULTISPECIES: anti-phage-associated helicase HerA [Pseudomonas]MBH3382061.1 ATP-binding protein [Pseudomonas asiatica]